MKTVVERSNAAYKESAGRLNTATLDRAGNAVTYRIYGCEKQRSGMYEKQLDDYEKTAVRAGMQVSSDASAVSVISMGSTVLILYFGSKNVLTADGRFGTSQRLLTFLSCYGKLAVKSSKAAKLFNSVQKANVSWKRIRPLLTEPPEETEEKTAGAVSLKLDQAGGAYPGGKQIFDGLTISAKPGQIIGITGPVACGKSTLGKIFSGRSALYGTCFVKRERIV